MNGQDGPSVLADQIAREQVGRIAAEFKQQGVDVESDYTQPGQVLMYAADQLLVNARYFDGVRSFLGKSLVSEQQEEVVDGVQVLRFAKPHFGRRLTVRSALDQIKKSRLSKAAKAAVAPNYVLTVAPETGPCPATEPEEVYFEIEPSPGVNMDDDSTGAGVKIYIADTGLLADAESHWWLKGVHGEPDPLEPVPGELIRPYAGHGTFVAGVVRCMARKADVFVSNAFKVAGSALESDFVKDLTRALDDGVNIFNLSVTTRAKGVLTLLGFEAWLTLLEADPNTVCVVAAGNNNSAQKFWPAAYAEENAQVVSVGALAADWRSRASFTNHGAWVDVYAPGRDLVNAYTTGTYQCQDAPYTGQLREFYGMAKWSGTSFSTPIVTGLIAARMTSAGEKAAQAATYLLDHAPEMPGVGAILLPYNRSGT